MLIEFSVENFRSIKERVTLSMLASDEEGLDGNLIETGVENVPPLLKSAVIYGANGSGKSNILYAFKFMVHYIRESHLKQRGEAVQITPFLFDHETLDQVSKFEVLFLYEGMQYFYGFALDKRSIHEEYLYYYPNDEQTLLFERTDTNQYKFGMDEAEQAVLSKRTLANALYLSIATQFNYGPIINAFDWFLDKLEFWVDSTDAIYPTEDMISNDPEFQVLVTELLRNVDIGIQDIELHPKESLHLSVPSTSGSIRFFEPPWSVRLSHSYLDSQGVQQKAMLDLEDESRGTQRLFDIIGPWIDVLKHGSILVVDELETSLHPLLVQQLLKIFQDREHNKKGAQLLFTTHNTTLLDTTIFRRDQVWFTEKSSEKGSTTLYSLVEYKPRANENVKVGYLLGRYGAIPFFGKEFLF